MKRIFSILLLLCSYATSASARHVEAGNWAAVAIGNRCLVYSLHPGRDTSGTLIFAFEKGGYNASFKYEYTPWPGDSGTPWDARDLPVFEVDERATDLGAEMGTWFGQGGYSLELSGGFIPDAVMYIMGAQQVGIGLERAAHGNELWIYGTFSTDGFSDVLSQAADWCAFDPRGLPRS